MKKKSFLIMICVFVICAVTFMIFSGTRIGARQMITAKIDSCERVSNKDAIEIAQPLLNKRISDFHEQYYTKQKLTNKQMNTVINLDSYCLYRINVLIVNPTYRYLEINPEKIYTSSNCIFKPSEDCHIDAFSKENVEFMYFVPIKSIDSTNAWLIKENFGLLISADNLIQTKYAFEFNKSLECGTGDGSVSLD